MLKYLQTEKNVIFLVKTFVQMHVMFVHHKKKARYLTMANYEIIKTCEDIDFNQVSEILKFYGLSDYDSSVQEKVFHNSYGVVFLKQEDKIIGVGRAISDGICQAQICNVAVRDEYRGKGLGKVVIDELLTQVKGCTVVLYTHPKHFGLYEHWGFSKMKTAYVLFHNEEHYREEGFI